MLSRKSITCVIQLSQVSQGFVLGHCCVFCLCQSVIEAYLREGGLAFKVISVLSWRQASLHVQQSRVGHRSAWKTRADPNETPHSYQWNTASNFALKSSLILSADMMDRVLQWRLSPFLLLISHNYVRAASMACFLAGKLIVAEENVCRSQR